ncbi:pantetheine-phosphate adenylyltransferase [Infirmifilum lucidum]|uniref:Pantetheine-phosphate adenylyltransferase n=1 Tax=Infirmifilum lucidum TaxID=2776706 RepID=A0A7L9FFI5_9CREN|nr:pantetheine-phosphate adenylyltransferase [Infirmifilum lucidum]QOJ78132.1 pantetheine-phosphate adenylyltransferase [Infirmifilum lucidum]
MEKGPRKPCRRGVVGGTFSLLHEGHKHLLSSAARLSETLLVGITSDKFASRKRHPVEPFTERASAVLNYLTKYDPELKVEIVEIGDVYGSAVDDALADCIFISEETVYGAFLINTLRRIKGLPPLRVYAVEILTVDGVKLSSTILWQRRAQK